jgi:hypothetical protein
MSSETRQDTNFNPRFIFNPPTTDSMSLPLYGGVIVITSSLGEELSIPYLGIFTLYMMQDN